MGTRIEMWKRHLRLAAASAAVLAVLGVHPTMSRAEDPVASKTPPTTRPARPNLRDAFVPGRRDFGPGGTAQGAGPRHPDQATQEETDAAIKFFMEHSPIRMNAYKELNENSQVRRNVTQALVRTYRPIQNFHEQNTDLYNLLVKQIALRDEAFALAVSAEKGDKDAEEKLHAKAEEIVDVSLKARSQRLEILQQQLTAQQNKLAEDQANESGQVDTELNEIRSDEQRLTGFMNRHRPNGTSPRGQANPVPELPADPLASLNPDIQLD